MDRPKTPQAAPELDAVIVGAGFSGLYMLHALRQLGLRARVFEAGDGIGGTWHWNRYPGARCDIESIEYSYQFSPELEQEWTWSERYAPQAEILDYLNHVSDRFALRDDIQLDTRVRSAVFDEASDRWTIETEAGDRVTARYCIMATGCLSSRNTPAFEGLDDFEGGWCHTGDWPRDGLDLSGKRVGVIGTGSSGVQSIPILAEQAAHLHVFQRTPTYTVPASNHLLDAEAVADLKANYATIRKTASEQPFGALLTSSEALATEASEEERRKTYEAHWKQGGLYFLGAYADLVFDPAANETAADFIRAKIIDVVDDPEVAAKLCPSTPVGCKRLCADTGYFETFNRPNVTLVDVSTAPIERLTATGIQTADAHYDLDFVVFATGFDAMTGSLLRIDIRGLGGLPLRDKWAEGPKNYLGLSIAGFPNLFHIAGPGSPSVLSNMVPSIEQHVNWIRDCIEYLDAEGITRFEAEPAAEEAWVGAVNEIANATVYPSCNSWYLGANIPGKPRVFMPYLGVPDYRARCDEIARSGYAGFKLTRAAVPASE